MDILEEILTALQTESRIMLATIVSTTGSTPASALSKMLVKNEGIVSVGTVGGGCMEGDVLLHAHRLYDSGKAEILTFHLNEDDIGHGLICGGSLDVLVEPVNKDDAPVFRNLKAIRDEGDDSLLATVISSDGVVKSKQVFPAKEPERRAGVMELLKRMNGAGGSSLENSISEAVAKASRRQETVILAEPEGKLVLEPVPGAPALILFGGGHVSKYVSRAASMAGFRVTVVDDREKFANAERFPEAAETLAMDFLESFNSLTIKPSTYIVIVTRGHRYDELILEQVIKNPPRYIGMIGSKRKVITTFDHLVARGVSMEALKRVHAPVGIEIGALTAEEISISIVSELISVRRGMERSVQHMSGAINLPPGKSE
jgi:xanthine dehydrogenase accessory factor